MKATVKTVLAGFGAILTGIAGYYAYQIYESLPTGTGYTAKYICSALFVSGRDLDHDTIVRNEIVPIAPTFAWVDTTVDFENKTVTGKVMAGLHRVTAVYREGLGCTLAVDTSAKKLYVQAEGVSAPAQLSSDLIWPLGEGFEVGVFPSEINRIKLEQALDSAFMEPGPDSRRNTHAVAVVYRGKLVTERYAPGIDSNTPLMGWSMSKSITNALVGVLVQAGKLDIDAPAPVPQWKHETDARGAITLDQLLRMSSGLAFTEVYVPGSDASEMLFNQYSAAEFAASRPLAYAPDEHWSYSSGTTNIISRIIKDSVGGKLADYVRFTREHLFDRVGMNSIVLEADASGSFVGSSYTYASARDWARFGLLYLNDGVWQDQRILPPGWVDYSTTPTAKAPQGQYGAQFWLNAGNSKDINDRAFPSLPPDMYWASGFSGQSVFVIPSRELVVVRLGTTLDGSWDKGQFMVDVLSAFKK